MPHTVVVDGTGRVLRRVDGSGESDWDELTAWLVERLESPP